MPVASHHLVHGRNRVVRRCELTSRSRLRRRSPAPVGIVVDVLRATSTIAQALGAGYQRVFCCREVEDAVALRKELGTGLLGGERSAVEIEGFDVGASPREFLEARDEPVIFSTTNGTRAILAAAGRCERSTPGAC